MNESYCKSGVRAATLYPRAARLVRAAEADIGAGRTRVVVGGLPPSVDGGSLRVEAPEGVDIVEVSVEERCVPESDASKAYLAAEATERELLDAITAQGARLGALAREYALFAAREPLAGSEGEPALVPENWGDYLEFMRSKLSANRAAAREAWFVRAELGLRLRAAREEKERLRASAGRVELCAAIVVDSTEARRAAFVLTHLQGGASWHPAYAIRVDPASAVVELSFNAIVRQESGEDWEGIALSFSTAMPLSDCSLPAPKSLRLREEESAPVMVAPASRASAKEEAPYSRDVACEAAAPEPERKMKKARTAKSEAGPSYGADLPSSAAGGIVAPSMVPPAPPPRPSPSGASRILADTAPEANSFDPYALLAAAESSLAANSGEERLPPAFARYLGLASPPADPALPPSPLAGVNDFFLEGTDPEESSGGYDWRYTAAKEGNSVPSSPGGAKIPIAALSFPARLEHVAVPSESEHAYLRASFTNSGTPLPRGPAQVFLGPDFVAGVDFPTTGSAQTATLSLGVDKDVKVKRREESRARGKGLGGKDRIIDVTARIEIASYRKVPTDIVVMDRVPIAQDPKLADVSGVKRSPKPASVSSRMVATWRERLEPGAKLTIETGYSIRTREDMRPTLSPALSPHFEGEA